MGKHSSTAAIFVTAGVGNPIINRSVRSCPRFCTCRRPCLKTHRARNSISLRVAYPSASGIDVGGTAVENGRRRHAGSLVSAAGRWPSTACGNAPWLAQCSRVGTAVWPGGHSREKEIFQSRVDGSRRCSSAHHGARRISSTRRRPIRFRPATRRRGPRQSGLACAGERPIPA